MRQVNFLILSASYVCRTGLRSLLEELEITGKVYLAEDAAKALKAQADILFIDTTKAFPAGIWEQGGGPGGTIRVGLLPVAAKTPPDGGGLYNYLLDLSLSKSELLAEIRKIIRESGFEEPLTPQEEKLSEREKTILRFVALGFTNRDIAEKLFISTHTVITHRKNITRKIGIKTVSGLTVYALLNHLVEMDEIKQQNG